MEGKSSVEIADMLGHKTLQMVKRYSHISDNHKKSVTAEMNSLIFGDK
jgi:integrase